MNFFKALKNLFSLLKSKKKYLFFFENSSSQIHFLSLLQYFNLEDYDVVSLEQENNIEKDNFYNLYNFYILILLFTFIKKKIIIMTTPDLDNLYLKKYSSNTYVYIHHSICSTHMIYNEKAFDNFDIIFNVGKFQNNEITYREKLKNLKKKRLINYGYGKLDHIINNNKITESNEVCIAPSWNFSSDYLDHVEKIIDYNLKKFRVRFRPHKNSFRYHKKRIEKIFKKYSNSKNFIIDLDSNNLDYIFNSKYFFSDWSGAAFEYAFSRLRPVIFFQSPMKIRNPNYINVPFEPVEINYRDKIGVLLKDDNFSDINIIYEKIESNLPYFKNMILKSRLELVYNIENCGQIGKNYLDSLD